MRVNVNANVACPFGLEQRRNPSQHDGGGGGGGGGGGDPTTFSARSARTPVAEHVGPRRDLPGVIVVRVGYSEPVR